MYYKKKYLIGIYYCEVDDDRLVALCDNSREFADFLEITIYNASTILNNLFTGKTKHIKYKGKLLEVYFIEN